MRVTPYAIVWVQSVRIHRGLEDSDVGQVSVPAGEYHWVSSQRDEHTHPTLKNLNRVFLVLVRSMLNT